MTNVRFLRKQGIVYGIEARGHAKFKTDGEDILCAAISTLTQSLSTYLQKVVGSQTLCTFKTDDKAGKLVFIIHNVSYANDIRVKTAFEMTKDALELISKDDEFKDYLVVEVKDDVNKS